MPILVACPSCGTRLRATDEMIGKKVKCARCATVFPALEGGPDPAITSEPIAFQDPPPARGESTYGFEDPEPLPRARAGVEPPSRMWRADEEEDDDRGRGRRPSGTNQNLVMSVVSIVLGCLAFPMLCFCAPLGMAASGCAILTGGIGLRTENAKVLALIGIVLGALGIVAYLVVLVFAIDMILHRKR